MIGEIRMFAGNFAPKNWAFCQGAIISIASNTALFSILGTTYGGNGTTTFALPNLSSRFAVGAGQGPGLSNIALGQMAGSENVTLTSGNLPAHTHMAVFNVNSSNGNQATPLNNFPSAMSYRVSQPGYTIQGAMYGTDTTGAKMAADFVTTGPAGNNQPIAIMNPYLGMNYVICMYGIFPSRG